MSRYLGQSCLCASIRAYRRWLSGRGPLRRVRCSFEACESCSAYGLRVAEQAPDLVSALRAIRSRLRRCGDVALYRFDDEVDPWLGWGPIYDELDELPRVLAEADELPVSAAAIVRMAARVARLRGELGLARSLAARAGRGPELIVREGPGLLAARRRQVLVRALLWAGLAGAAAIVLALIGASAATIILVALAGLALASIALLGPLRHVLRLQARFDHLAAARCFHTAGLDGPARRFAE